MCDSRQPTDGAGSATYAVKVRPAGAVSFFYLRPFSDPRQLTNLRFHAALFTEDGAESMAAQIERDNPGVKAKSVSLFG